MARSSTSTYTVKYPCTVKRLLGGGWQASSLGSDVGNVTVVGDSREQAVAKLRSEIRYRLEWCPCSAVAADYVELDVREAPPEPWQARPR